MRIIVCWNYRNVSEVIEHLVAQWYDLICMDSQKTYHLQKKKQKKIWMLQGRGAVGYSTAFYWSMSSVLHTHACKHKTTFLGPKQFNVFGYW